MKASKTRFIAMVVALVAAALMAAPCAWAADEGAESLQLQAGLTATDADDADVAVEEAADQAFTKATKKLSVNSAKGWVVANGKYYAVSAKDTNLALGISKQKAVLKEKSASNKSQIWQFAFDYDTQCYTITNVKTGKVLTATDKAKAGAAVKEAKLVKTSQRLTRYATRTVPLPTQRWYLYSSKNGYQFVPAQNTNVVLDIRNGAAKLVKRANAKNARFWLMGATGTYMSNGISEGTYVVQSALDKKTLSIAKSSVKEKAAAGVGNAITIWGQMFDFEYYKKGYYKIVSYNSGKLLTASGKKVVQQDASSSLKDRQLWKLTIVGSTGAVQIVNKKSGKALTYNGSKLKLAKAVSAEDAGSVPKTQKWRISPTTTGLTDTGKKALYRANKLSSKTQWCIAIDMTAHEFFLFTKAKASQTGAPWKLDFSCRCATGRNKCTWAGTTATGGMSVYRDGIGAKWCITAQHGSFIHSVLWGGGGNEQLGWFISHGCIRIPFSNAEYLYKTISPGTRITRWYK